MGPCIQEACPSLSLSLSVKQLSFPGVITRTPLGFVWLSIRLQQDLMTFIIRWWNLIWAPPLSEMSGLIWSYAGENKRGSNYSLRAQVRWAQFVGDEERSGSRHRGEESERERRGVQGGLWKKSIVSCHHQVMRFWARMCFLIVTGVMVHVIIHGTSRWFSKQKKTWGWHDEPLAGTD